jgi:trans-aconitate 2-methyltransferase
LGWFQQDCLDKSIARIYHALKNDGIFALQTSYKKNWCPQFYKSIAGICSNAEYAKMYNSFNWKINHFDMVSNYTLLLEKNKLEITTLITEVTSQSYTIEEAYNQFTTSIMNAYGNQNYYDLAINEEYIAELHSCLLKGLKALSNNNKIELNYHRLYVLSKKNG